MPCESGPGLSADLQRPILLRQCNVCRGMGGEVLSAPGTPHLQQGIRA